MNCKIAIGTDHAGFDLKNIIVEYLEKKQFDVKDYGAIKFDKEDDYPDLIKPVALAVSKGEFDFGIILGYSGQGEAIVANRIKGVRAIVYNSDNIELIKLSREHNNANIISIGAGFVDKKKILNAIDLFLNTDFSNIERHKRRIEKINNLI